ncbi:MAG: magnesium transporter CorA family protein [Spirochaetaceae bacterium]|jgi:magnesium transporter|nr:magnesium transporter CorA family protein [Spirochaetaceae bacterium]
MVVVRKRTPQGFVECPDVASGCWIDARNVSAEDLVRLENDFGLSAELLADIMDVDEQSRIELEDEYTVIIVRVPVYDTALEAVYYTVPIGIILFADTIVTVCQRSSDAIDDIALNRVRGLSMQGKPAFVLNILGRAALTYLKALKQLNRNAAHIEYALQKSVRNNELIQLLSTQKSLVYLTTSLKGNANVLERIKRIPSLKLKDDDCDLWEDVVTDNAQALEMSNIYSSIMTGTMDAFASVISNNLNIVMKRLALINIILMIPTLIYSFYGMNVHLPFQDFAGMAFVITGFSLAAAVIGVWLVSWGSSTHEKINPKRKFLNDEHGQR